MELLGIMPLKVARTGKYAKDLFDSRGRLRNIRELRFWSATSARALRLCVLLTFSCALALSCNDTLLDHCCAGAMAGT